MKPELKQSMGVIGLAVLAITIIITAIVFSEFDEAADNIGLTTPGQAAVDNVTQNTYI